MATVREFVEGDIPAAAALFMRVSPQHGWSTRAACESYFRKMLFNNPWRDLRLPSWVAEVSGRIVGFYAIMPRPMTIHERSIRVAVACQIAVEPRHRQSLAALKLVQACLSGPQDLTLADGAHDRSRRMWLGIGGAAPLLYNLQWIRLLRPARYVLSLLEEHTRLPRLLMRAARPLSTVADSLAARRLSWNRFYREHDGLVERALDPPSMLAYLPDVCENCVLRPVYDARSLAWVLEEAARKTSLGTLRARAVCDGEQPIGWYAYYARPGGVSEVLQIAARKDSFDDVLRRLLVDAWRAGAAAVRGRVEPRHIDELSARHCWLRREGCSMLVHSRHTDVLEAIRRNDAFLSRLEGEWWLRFVRGQR